MITKVLTVITYYLLDYQEKLLYGFNLLLISFVFQLLSKLFKLSNFC